MYPNLNVTGEDIFGPTRTSRYLDDLLNIDNIHFEHMVHRIYPAELQLNKANVSDTEAAVLDFNFTVRKHVTTRRHFRF